jgi:hypothetical protein
MKKNIKEQSVPSKATVDPGMKNVVNAPKGELDILQKNGILRGKGVLSNLALYPDGNPRAIQVGNRKYYAAKIYERPGKDTLYLTYDGRILVKISDGVYKYKLDPKTNQPYLIDGIADTGLQLQFTNVLTQFGINPDDPQTDVYFYLNGVTQKLQKFITQGAVSNMFRLWNDMLTYYFPSDYRTNPLHQLQPKDVNTPFTPPIDKYELDNGYEKLTDVSRYGLSYQGKEFPIYLPKGASKDTTFKKREKLTDDECRTKLLQYLGTAMDWQMRGGSTNTTLQQFKGDIIGCSTSGGYDNFRGATKEDLKNYVDFSDKNSPFGFLRQGRTLSWKNIQNILAGKSDVLKGGNPYIIGNQIYESKEDNLKSLIKENLITLSEEKKKNLLGESKIINTRFGIISESNTKDNEKLFNDVISEMFYLNNQGFDKELINEGFWEILKGLFPSTDVIAQWFKEYMAKWLIKAIAPGQEDGWIGNIIITTVGNLKVGDITKLTNCEFTTKLLSKSISEGVIRKFAESKGVSGALADLIRNSMVEHLDSTEFVQKLESGLAHVICPLLGGVAQKMSTVANTMKDKAIAG